MTGSEEKYQTASQRKSRIQERYKGVSPDMLNVIPAVQVADFYHDNRSKRVAVYARVSTDDPHQTTSYELQKNHYTDVVTRHEGWELGEIYADEGISGTSLRHREAFIKMIDNCKAGKIDMIITKSVSRFARNVLDCIGHVRELAKMQPPIGVFFETENLYTLDKNNEMILTFMSTLAQEESHVKSDIMNASIEMRFRRGIFLTPALLGYDLDENGDLVINQEEAKTVRLIFFMYLFGYTCTQIAETLTRLERRTKKGNTKWSESSILQQLQNERHCGDVLSRKTWTPNYLDHKSRKNRHDKNQYYMKDHHEPIISRDDFIAVQRLINNARYGGDRLLPKLKVIDQGILKGFVIINPKWGAFSVKDYQNASRSVYEGKNAFPDKLGYEVFPGDADLTGFEVARAEFFSSKIKTMITLSTEYIRFSGGCIKKLPSDMYVELLIHPDLKVLVIRPTTKGSKNAVKWCVFKNTGHQATSVGGKAYLPMIYEMFGWDTSCRYCIRGAKHSCGDESVLAFRMTETEVVYREKHDKQDDSKNPKALHAFPMHWSGSFGDEYYRRAQIDEIIGFNKTNLWKTAAEGMTYDTDGLNVTPHDVLRTAIDEMISTGSKENTSNAEQ